MVCCRSHCRRTWALRQLALIFTLADISSRLCYVTGFFRDGLSHVKTGERILEALEKDRLLLSAAGSQDLDNILVAKMGIFHSSACIATEIGDFSLSLEMFGKQLDVYKQGFGKNVAHPAGDEKKLRRIFGGIANSYQGLGHHLEAEKYYDRCLEEARDQDELHSPFPVNKCRSQWARGAYDDASTELERLVSLREKKYGTNDSEDYM
jgi:tetratricopeptide (TPR) repeat protein